MLQERKIIDRRLAELNVARARCREEAVALEALATRQGHLREALALAQGVAVLVQEAAHRKIADVVSRSLEAVFDKPYKFKIRFEQKRGRTEASLVFERDGMELDPISASGGGVVAVASFALRLSCLLLARPPLRRLLVLDEPFAHLSAEYVPRLRQLIEALAKEMDCQLIIVTHQDALRIGKVVEL